MKKITEFLIVFSLIVVAFQARAVVTPQCSNLYWLDNTNKTCESPKQFCGTYIYFGLRTFNNQQDYLSAVNSKQSHSFGTVTLKNESKGEGVKELQRFLNQVSDLGVILIVDGKLGPKTVMLIKQWQRVNNLTPDGLVGRDTKEKMNVLAGLTK